MALQASGPISFSQIANEFGLPPGKNLGAYRISKTVGDLTLPLDSDSTNEIPISGSIRFSNFYNKRLNIVVYCNGTRVTARTRYNLSSGVTVIGGYKNRPSSSSGCKIWIHTNELISSNIPASSAPNRQYSSLITGGWDSDTDLRLDIGPSGVVTGAGGAGGAGGGNSRNGSRSCSASVGGAGLPGGFATSAIGVNYQPIIITNRGRIQGGTGGGGGGGKAYSENRRTARRDVEGRAGGGGGGGGMGSPAGAGGSAGCCTGGARTRIQRFPTNGTSGGLTSQGSGGVGAIVTGDSRGSLATTTGGNGGGGGSSGGAGAGNECSGVGGAAGASGIGIIITNNGTGVTITNNGTLIGGIEYNTSVS